MKRDESLLKMRVYGFGVRSYYYFDHPKDYPSGIPGSVSLPERWTGIKDANGVDIYEGDIIEYEHKGSWLNEEATTIQQIVVYRAMVDCHGYCSSGFATYSLGNSSWLGAGLPIPADCRIVGNVHTYDTNC